MKAEELCHSFNIPEKILEEYQKMGFCHCIQENLSENQYDAVDLRRLSLMITLHDLDFTEKEIQQYMDYVMNQNMSQHEVLKLLNIKRNQTLNDIHSFEKRLNCLDYLRHQIKKGDKYI